MGLRLFQTSVNVPQTSHLAQIFQRTLIDGMLLPLEPTRPDRAEISGLPNEALWGYVVSTISPWPFNLKEINT
jgi:hypothetical protein